MTKVSQHHTARTKYRKIVLLNPSRQSCIQWRSTELPKVLRSLYIFNDDRRHENAKTNFMEPDPSEFHEEPYGRDDEATQRAETEILKLFVDPRKRPLRTPYYLAQLQVLHEKEFFPWVTAHALEFLVEQDKLFKLPQTTKAGRHVVFFYNSSLSGVAEESRIKTHASSVCDVID